MTNNIELFKELQARTIDDAAYYVGGNYVALGSDSWQDVLDAAVKAINSIGRGRPDRDSLAILATTAREAADGYTAEFAANLRRIAEIADALA
ncbi:hypothetical protein [Nocardia paucivorans]|uniref:hypothetical protein n=1 Tax=Nocardia paucivorans TaxID=114259 RepID=UPI00030AC764|nr:hypothetical protein [Nocardia paucivorans]